MIDVKLKYRAAVFDLDGTILDTLEDLKNSTNRALERSGFPQRSLEEIREFVGRGMRHLISRAVPDGTPEDAEYRVLRDFIEDYKIHSTDNTAAYPGISDTIKDLRSLGVKTAVVSNKGDFAVQDLVAKFFPGLFDAVTGEREGIRRKPAPDSVEAVLRALSVSNNDAVYIGDSEVDIETAKNAGTDAVLVAWGFRGREYLRAHGARVIAEEPGDLLRFVTVTER